MIAIIIKTNKKKTIRIITHIYITSYPLEVAFLKYGCKASYPIKDCLAVFTTRGLLDEVFIPHADNSCEFYTWNHILWSFLTMGISFFAGSGITNDSTVL